MYATSLTTEKENTAQRNAHCTLKNTSRTWRDQDNKKDGGKEHGKNNTKKRR